MTILGEMVRTLAGARAFTGLCGPAYDQYLRRRIDQWLNDPIPAGDTPVGRREHHIRGVWILRDMHAAIARRRDQ